jgi:elongator complex protein 1
MYKNTLKTKDQSTKAQQSQSAIDSKVNRICDAFLAVLEQPQYKEAHLQNIITAHVSKTPPDLESGLEMIGRLQQAQDILTEKAAEHICFLADVNQLYDKDPREYLPHLQSLHDLSPLRRKFQIDDQLGRRTKAVSHLKDIGVFNEVLDYVRKHILYAEALKLYQYDKEKLKEIMKIYADYLATSNRHKEAAIAYEFLQDYASAWPHYRSANLWQEALSSATLAGVPESELTSLATSLAEGMSISKSFPLPLSFVGPSLTSEK